jgi:hypothetical protein
MFIPKNHLSAKVTNANALKSSINSTETITRKTFSDLNKAEENLMNVFLNASESSNSSSSTRNLFMYLLTFCNIATHITNTIIIYYLYYNMLLEIKKEAPHIRSIFETASFQTSCSMAFMLYASLTNKTGIMQLDKTVQIERYQSGRSNSLLFLMKFVLE